MVTPTSPTVAFKLGERTADPLSMYLSDYYTTPVSLAGIPAISIPCGLSEGLPVGLQLIGPAFSESRILRRRARARAGDRLRGGAAAVSEVRRYEPVIGIEIHVQLRTRTKMFCGCANAFGAPPNTLTCPVCLAHPGTLPVANAEAVHLALMIAMALRLRGRPSARSSTARTTSIRTARRATRSASTTSRSPARGTSGDVRIHRVHMEEDAAKLVHAGASGRIHGAERSVVDFNRAGTPLVEIVTEPDLRSAAEAAEFGRLLQATLRRMGVSDVNMEEGSLRMDANVSIRPAGEATLGTKTELKNMNSFRFLERGIVAEIERQEAHPARRRRGRAGDAPLRSALGQRSPRCARRRRRTTTATSRSPTSCRSRRPRRCSSAPARRCRSCRPRAPSGSSASSACPRPPRGCLRSAPSSATSSRRRWPPAAPMPRSLANWVVNEVPARIGDADPADTRLEPGALAALVAMVEAGEVAQSAAKEVLDELVEKGGDPHAIVAARGLGRAGSRRAGADRGARHGRERGRGREDQGRATTRRSAPWWAR